jgi:uncharacterized protein with HEPN domain
MPRNIGHLLDDILQAIARIEELTAGKSFEEFDASWELQWLVQRESKSFRRPAGVFRTI